MLRKASLRINNCLSLQNSPIKLGGIFLSFIFNFRRNKPSLKFFAISGLVLTAVLFFSAVAPVHAQSVADQSSSLNQGVEVISQPLGLPTTDLRLIIANIIRGALALLGIIFVVLFIYSGFLWMTSGGNEEQVGSAKKIMRNAIIGIIIILCAYTIVVLVMRLLGLGESMGTIGNGTGEPGTENFEGSGGLGGIVRDHYPMRNQKDVARNTKIVITFRKPVSPSSFIIDKTGNGIYGDCNTASGSIDWENGCDQLKDNVISIIRADNKIKIRGAAALISYENNKAFTVVIRPYDYLGNDTDKIPYTVNIGKGIMLDDPNNPNISIFAGRSAGNDYYEWQFICDTVLDNAPPHVASVFPALGDVEVKNSVIQIDFNEPIDPTGIQGQFFNSGNGYFAAGSNNVANSNIFLKASKSSLPAGSFRLVNGYRTLEFTPSTECGQNACGQKIYCLPVCDAPGAACKRDMYDFILKAAEAINTKSFEAKPFTGFMDLSGNSLDSSVPYGDAPKQSPTSLPIFDNWKAPDHYFWSFEIKDELDITAPFIKQVTPGPDATFINAQATWSILFSKRMRAEPMYEIGIEEKPAQKIPLCKVPQTTFFLNNTTLTNMYHCDFLDATLTSYYPIVDSQIQDVHFNCLYPGLGPKGLNQDKTSFVCDGSDSIKCCLATSTPSQSFCCNGVVSGNSGQPSGCIKNL